MEIHSRLQTIFTLANPDRSIYKLSDIKNCLYGPGRNVFIAAFGSEQRFEHLTSAMISPALDLIAKEVFNYLGNSTVETPASFNKWHDSTCSKFLAELNRNLAASGFTPMHYGKAQKVLNMLMKYLYCCHDAPSAFSKKKFDFCHMAIDGYIYNGYRLPFYRDVVYPTIHHGAKANNLTAWSQLSKEEYKSISDDIKSYISAHGKTFNDYLNICSAFPILNGVDRPLANIQPLKNDCVLTPFEAEFFIWPIAKSCQKKDEDKQYIYSISTVREIRERLKQD